MYITYNNNIYIHVHVGRGTDQLAGLWSESQLRYLEMRSSVSCIKQICLASTSPHSMTSKLLVTSVSSWNSTNVIKSMQSRCKADAKSMQSHSVTNDDRVVFFDRHWTKCPKVTIRSTGPSCWVPSQHGTAMSTGRHHHVSCSQITSRWSPVIHWDTWHICVWMATSD